MVAKVRDRLAAAEADIARIERRWTRSRRLSRHLAILPSGELSPADVLERSRHSRIP